MKLRHEWPDISYKEKAIDFVDEFKKNNSRIHGGGRIARYLESSTYEEWLKYIEQQKTIPVDESHVPEETYFLVDDVDNIIGIINIRLCLNDMLRDLGGHIGFSIRPSERGKGYNKINLYLGLLQEQQLGEKRILLECLADNIGSNKTITALGGILEKSEIDDWDNELTNYYWIDVDKSIDEYKNFYEQFIFKANKNNFK